MKSNTSPKKKKIRNPIEKLKNFAPVAFESKLVAWSDKEIRIINWIKKRYKFDIDFDLREHLSRMPTDIMSFNEYDRQLPTSNETTHSLIAIKEQSIIFKAFLSDKLLPLMAEGRNNAETLCEMLEITGTKHRALIAENSIGGYKSLHETISSLETFVNDDYLFRLHKVLEQIITGISNAESKIPPSKRGRKQVNLEKGIIHKLLHIYTTGTSKIANCLYHRTNGRFHGEFYFFMMTALTLLRRNVKIKVMQPGTWGDYAREIIKYHYRDKQT